MTVSDLLLDCLELCKCTRIAMDVYHQCQLSDDYGFIAKVSISCFSLCLIYTFSFLLLTFESAYNITDEIYQVLSLA